MESLNQTIYPTIFKRKSTRAHSGDPVSKDDLERIQTFMQEVVPLIPSKQALFKILPHKGNALKIGAFAEDEAIASINLAFMLHQMDLFLQTNGIGSLWNATVRATEKEYQGLPYRVCLIFGMAKGNPVRVDVGQFNRKKTEDISNKPDHFVVEAVQLAPSARNRQPWYLMCGKNQIDFYCKKDGLIDNIFLKGLHWFDLGIAVCHAVLALQEEGFSPDAFVRNGAPDKEGYIYSISLSY